jgi:hypothetical protein
MIKTIFFTKKGGNNGQQANSETDYGFAQGSA